MLYCYLWCFIFTFINLTCPAPPMHSSGCSWHLSPVSSSTLRCPREAAWFPPSPGQRLQGHVLSAKSLWGFTHSFILKHDHYPPYFLWDCQQHIILPSSATRATTPTVPEPAFPVIRKKSVGAHEWQQLFWESVLAGWQIPPFLRGA